MSTTQDFAVTGMTCDHCVRAVTTELLGVTGVTAVDVALSSGGASIVTVVSEAPLDRAVVAEAIDEAGYELAPE